MAGTLAEILTLYLKGKLPKTGGHECAEVTTTKSAFRQSNSAKSRFQGSTIDFGSATCKGSRVNLGMLGSIHGTSWGVAGAANLDAAASTSHKVSNRLPKSAPATLTMMSSRLGSDEEVLTASCI